MTQTASPGLCPSCEQPGPVGAECPERGCRGRGYRFIPAEHLRRALTALRPGGRLDPEIGQTIGKWLVVGRLGAGGFGNVFLALQTPSLRLQGALKVLRAEEQGSDAGRMMLRKFEDEAEALSRLRHTNIVQILDRDEHGGAPFLVMELVENGRTLKSEIASRARRGQGFETAEVEHLLGQVLYALEAAHAARILHRDIKPENIMLQEEAGNPHRVRVLDFGLAKFLESSHETSMILGTPMYTAPEQIARGDLGPWTDLYAVGVLAFELLSGRHPFSGGTHKEILLRKLDPDYDPTSQLVGLDLPDALLAFFKKALCSDPERRYRSAGELRAALSAALGGLDRTQPMVSRDLSALVDSSELRRQREELAEERRRLDDERRELEALRRRGRSPWPALGLVGLVAMAGVAWVALRAQSALPEVRLPSVTAHRGAPSFRIDEPEERAAARPAEKAAADATLAHSPPPDVQKVLFTSDPTGASVYFAAPGVPVPDFASTPKHAIGTTPFSIDIDLALLKGVTVWFYKPDFKPATGALIELPPQLRMAGPPTVHAKLEEAWD